HAQMIPDVVRSRCVSTGRATDLSGAYPTQRQSRTFLVIHYVTYVGIIAHAGFIALFYFLHVPLLALFNVYSVAAWIAARMTNQRLMPRLAALLLVTEVISHAVLAVHLLGWDSGFHYYLIPLIPFLIFNDQLANRTVIAGSMGVGLIYLVLRAATQGIAPPAGWAAIARWVEVLNIV